MNLSKKIYQIIIISFVSVLIQNSCLAQANYVEGQVIVRIQENVSIDAYKKEIAPIELTKTRLLARNLNIWLLHYSTPKEVKEVIKYLETKSSTIYAQANHITTKRSFTIPNDPLYFNNQKDYLDKIGMRKAWSIETGGYTKDGDQIVVAVIDFGFFLSMRI